MGMIKSATIGYGGAAFPSALGKECVMKDLAVTGATTRASGGGAWICLLVCGCLLFLAESRASVPSVQLMQTRLDAGNWTNAVYRDLGLVDPGKPFWLDFRFQNLGSQASGGRAEVNVWAVGQSAILDTRRGDFAEVLVFPPGSLKPSRSGTALVTTQDANAQASRHGWRRLWNKDFGVRLMPPEEDPLHVWVSVVYRDEEGRIVSEVDSDFSDVQGNRVYRFRIFNNVSPEITVSPEDAVVSAGIPHSFVVSWRHRPPFLSRSGFREEQTHIRFQWEVSDDGGNSWAEVPGATDPSLRLANPRQDMSGWQYRAVVSNRAGAVVSDAAVLEVRPPAAAPEFARQPADAEVRVGEVAAFVVEATGLGELAYQWQKAAPGEIGRAHV